MSSPDVPAALDSIVAHALDPEPAGRYPNGQAFASALESLVTHADPSSPTVATDQAALAAAAAALAHGAPSSVGVAPPMPGSVAPLRPAPAGPTGRAGLATARPAGLGAVRRASPVIAAPLMVLLLVVGVVVAALLLAALPGGGSTGVAFASPTPRATQRPTAALRPGRARDRARRSRGDGDRETGLDARSRRRARSHRVRGCSMPAIRSSGSPAASTPVCMSRATSSLRSDSSSAVAGRSRIRDGRSCSRRGMRAV